MVSTVKVVERGMENDVLFGKKVRENLLMRLIETRLIKWKREYFRQGKHQVLNFSGRYILRVKNGKKATVAGDQWAWRR